MKTRLQAQDEPKGQAAEAPRPRGTLRQPEVLLSLILLAVVAAGSAAGWSYYKREQQAFERAAESELSAVADLKVAQIANWRQERLADANQILETELIRETVRAFLDEPANGHARTRLLDWMTVFRRHGHITRVVLLDTHFEARLAVPENENWVGPLAASFAAAALQTNRVLVSDLHISQVSQRANMDYLVPLVLPAGPPGGAPVPCGVLLMEVEPTEFLFPNLQSWPTPSRTAETLLVRREGEEVVFLNELRHQTNTALKLRFALTQAPNLPATRAVQGEQGVVRSVDYRQQPVLAALRRVPDSPWFLVAKRDEAEINTPLRKQAWIIGQTVGALILAGMLGVLLVWRNREYRFSVREIEQRKRTEGALRQSEERFRSFTAATFEGICVSQQGRILDFNEQFAALFGYARAELLGREILTLVAPESRPLVAAALQSDRETVYEHQLVRKDGSRFEVEAQARVSLWEGGKVRLTAVRDISERRRGQAKLEKIQNELLRTSHLAGMAEVATSVLHNVGNVLNSVNVSTSLVSDQMKHSKLANLTRATALMRQHAANLGEFLTRDPKGAQVLPYLEQLGDHLLQEQDALLKELAALRNNVEHIRDIVAMQQNYAKLAGTVEPVQAAELIEDALRMNSGSLRRHEVQVIRDYAPDQLPEVTVVRHKVLQILVNLIRNAKYACDESGRSDKRLILRAVHEGEKLKISVVDNGVGIAAENLSRLFTHGFTTRKEGHGFGLHSSLAAAKELGGALYVHSDGPGQGAVFTLELPLQPKERGA